MLFYYCGNHRCLEAVGSIKFRISAIGCLSVVALYKICVEDVLDGCFFAAQNFTLRLLAWLLATFIRLLSYS